MLRIVLYLVLLIPTTCRSQSFSNALTLAASFSGIDGGGGGAPDPFIAVGPKNLMLVTNYQIAIRDRQGRPIEAKGLGQFFASVESTGEGTSDPEVLFDVLSGRFFVSAAGVAGNRNCTPGSCISHLFLAVSKTASPATLTGADWFFYALDGTLEITLNGSRITANLVDFPHMAVVDNVVVATWQANDSSGAFQGGMIRLLDKSLLLRGAPVTTWIDFLRAGSSRNLQPAVTFGSPGVIFLISRLPCGFLITGISGPPSALTIATFPIETIAVCQEATTAVQPSGLPLEIRDDSGITSQPVYRNGRLWAARTVGQDYGSGVVSAIHWMEVDVSAWPLSPRVIQNSILGSDGVWYFYPAMMVDSSSNMAMLFGRSSREEFPSLYYAGRFRSDLPGLLRAPALLRAGVTSVNQVDPLGRNRYGDYFSAASDPSNDSIWIFGQYGGNATAWSTWVGNVVTPPAQALAQVAAGGNLTMGIFVLNTGAVPAQYSINFYDDQGNPIALPFTSLLTTNLSGTLPAQGSAYYEAGDPQIQTLVGWAQITADSSIVVQALFRNNVNGNYYEAAVPSTSSGKEFLIPFDATTFAPTGQPLVTGVAIANLDPVPANITCVARDPNGVTIPNAVPVPSLAPLGHWADFQFPLLGGQRGTIDCFSNTNISGLALRFLGPELSSLPVVTNPASLAGPAKTGAVAQVAAGSNLTTGILILNTGATPAQYSIAFYGDQGNSIALPFTTGTASTLSGTIPAHGSAYYETGNPQLPLVAGWGLFTADSSIVVQALFRNSVNGTYYEAAIPSTPGSKEVLFPFDATTFAPTGQPLVTGVAIANFNPTSANVTCTALDPNGAVIPNAVTVPTLAPLGHWASYQFPALVGLRGTIDCTSNTNISATALRFLGNALSSLPVVLK